MFSPERLDEPLLAEFYDYWVRSRRGRGCPARSDIDPVEIPRLLPHLAITEIVDDGSTVRLFKSSSGGKNAAILEQDNLGA